MLIHFLGLILATTRVLAQSPPISATNPAKPFVVPSLGNGQDDSPALIAAMPQVLNGTFNQVIFEKGKTYSILTPINFGAVKNVEISIQGNITLPTNITFIQATVNNTSIYPGAWFVVKGTNVTFRGSTDSKWGWVDGHGQQWWDANNTISRPKIFSFGTTNLLLRDVKVFKPIAAIFSMGATNAQIFNNRIEAKSSTSSFPFNTDGFDVSGVNIFLQGNHIVNGDDCITINNGATNVHATDNYCEGGHGLSIGSLGKAGSVANVSNILFENAVMVNSLYGARFKSWSGGKGIATNVTWRNVAFWNVPFPIFVTQNYWDQNVGPKPPTTANSTNTAVADFRWENFIGTINDRPGYVEGSCVSDPCWYFVPGATGKEVVILDVAPGTATNLFAKNIFAKTETGARVTAMCNSTSITTDVGFVCQDGPFVPTR